MASNGRGRRSRWDHAADVAQTVRAAAASSKDLRSRRPCPAALAVVTAVGVTRWHKRCGTAKLKSTAGATGGAPMCDYSLQNVKTRPAKIGDKLFTRRFSSGTGGFSAPEDINVAVCLLPGTEPSFAYEVRRSRLGLGAKILSTTKPRSSGKSI